MSREEKQQTYLFIVRVWQENIDAGESEWRGRLQLVPLGERRYFRDWDALISSLISMLPKGPTDG